MKIIVRPMAKARTTREVGKLFFAGRVEFMRQSCRCLTNNLKKV